MNKKEQDIRWFLPPEGMWCKANLHCHTTLSDGAWTPERVKAEYQKRGYSVVAYTDHNAYHFHKSLCDESFVALAALEVNIDKPMQQSGAWNITPVYHLNFYDTKPESRALPVPLPKRFDDSPHAVNLYIEQMKKLGFFCCYNHPWWSLQTSEVYRQLRGLDAFEIYNFGCEQEGLYGYAPQAYAELLRGGSPLACLATDDNHNALAIDDPLCDAFGGFTILKVNTLSYGDVVQALQNRWAYASNGPRIEALYRQGGILVVECSEVEKIYVHGVGRAAHKAVAKQDANLVCAKFALDAAEPYFWVELRDHVGRFAASSAYAL